MTVCTQWATGAFDSLSWVKLRAAAIARFRFVVHANPHATPTQLRSTWRADTPLVTDIPSHGAQEDSQIGRASLVHACQAVYIPRFGCPRGCDGWPGPRSFFIHPLTHRARALATDAIERWRSSLWRSPRATASSRLRYPPPTLYPMDGCAVRYCLGALFAPSPLSSTYILVGLPM